MYYDGMLMEEQSQATAAVGDEHGWESSSWLLGRKVYSKRVSAIFCCTWWSGMSSRRCPAYLVSCSTDGDIQMHDSNLKDLDLDLDDG